MCHVFVCSFFFFLKEKVNPPCEMTERQIFTMATQVASALVSILINMSLHFRPQVGLANQ